MDREIAVECRSLGDDGGPQGCGTLDQRASRLGRAETCFGRRKVDEAPGAGLLQGTGNRGKRPLDDARGCDADAVCEHLSDKTKTHAKAPRRRRMLKATPPM